MRDKLPAPKISEDQLNRLHNITGVKPTKGYVYEYNIPLWFSSKKNAEQFYEFLNQTYHDKFDWARVMIEKEDRAYVVNIMSKENIRTFHELFYLPKQKFSAEPSDFEITPESIELLQAALGFFAEHQRTRQWLDDNPGKTLALIPKPRT